VQYRQNGGGQLGSRQLRQHIGVLAHSSFVYGELTGLENLHFYGRLYGVADVAERARTLLDEVGLDDKARDRAARTYSRGMLQRLALARALLHDPRILLLDEPFTGLDRAGSAALARALAAAKQQGRILLVVTHDFESIAGFTDHVVVLRRGRIVHEDRRVAADTGPDGFCYEDLKTLYHQHTE
jgi:heme exporter protein A